jgi:hypothetical protein
MAALSNRDVTAAMLTTDNEEIHGAGIDPVKADVEVGNTDRYCNSETRLLGMCVFNECVTRSKRVIWS